MFGDNIVKLPQGFDEQRELGEKTRNAVRLPIRGDVRILGFCILGRTQNISLTPLPNVRFVSPSVTRGGAGCATRSSAATRTLRRDHAVSLGTLRS